MGRRTRELPAQVEAVRRRIERWRSTRERRTRMPAGLWQAAASVAREHGLWSVSRALRVNYESLKQQVAQLGPEPERRAPDSAFVEMDARQLIGESPGTLIELSDADGSRLTIRLAGGAGLDVQGLAASFWQRGP